MSATEFTNDQLLAYFDEMLAVDQMVLIEEALRQSGVLRTQLANIIQARDAGMHSIGEIWRRERLSCPSRSQLGSYLLGTAAESLSEYIPFHIDQVGCRICAANLEDLQSVIDATPETAQRRQRYFQTSVGYLKDHSK